VAQAEVSKYLSGDYSGRIAALEREISRRRLGGNAVRLAISGDKRALEKEIGSLASDSRIVRSALRP
jgi:hypothetical protein